MEAHPRIMSGQRQSEGVTESRQPVPVKEWSRRHHDGSLGSVVAWSDGRYTAGYFEYRPKAGGIQVGPRYPYPTLADAFGGADRDAATHGHACTDECTLWGEVSPSSSARS